MACQNRGRIRDWHDVGDDRHHPIDLFAEDDGTSQLFQDRVLKGASLAAHTRHIEDNQQLASLVAGDQNAIGFVGFPYARDVAVLTIGDGSSEAVLPSKETIASEKYVLSRRLYLYTKAQARSPLASAFVRFVKSPEGQNIMDTIGFVRNTSPPVNGAAVVPRRARHRATPGNFVRDLCIGGRFVCGNHAIWREGSGRESSFLPLRI